jgi:hypothetical protein
VGSLKVDHLLHYKSPVALKLMQAIKQALDPDNLMNPGRVIRLQSSLFGAVIHPALTATISREAP